ncbi:MAG TPA: HU family DNA-binding protein [bacterium]|nr:HU family DNA-binding protein [bacterium]
MNKPDIISNLAEKLAVEKTAVERVLSAFEELVIETLKKGEEISLTGFGTFSAKHRSARMGVNPQNPSVKIEIKAVTVPKFKAGKTLKDSLKK